MTVQQTWLMAVYECIRAAWQHNTQQATYKTAIHLQWNEMCERGWEIIRKNARNNDAQHATRSLKFVDFDTFHKHI